MAVNCSPFGPKPQFEISSGVPAVGNKLFFYVAGSVNTKQNTYTDSTGSVANANPIILNSLGQPTTEIWFTAGQGYKVVYAPSTDTDPPTSPIWTIDNLRGINDTVATFDQWIAGPAPIYVSATQFTLVGDQTSIFEVGRRVKTTNTSGTVYGRITVSTFGALTTITVANDGGSALDSGLSAVSYALLSATGSSLPSIPTPVPQGGAQIQPISATVAASALTITLSPTTLDFRSTTIGSGAVSVVYNFALSLVVPSGATLGTVNAIQSRLVVLAINNAGTMELAVVNIAGGNDLTETGLISTTAISAAATAANVIYSTTARTNVAYRVIGFVESTQATAGTWATAPSKIQGCGGQAMAAMSSIGYGQVWTDVSGSRSLATTYYNTTGRPIQLSVSLAYSAATGSVDLRVNGTPMAYSASAGGVNYFVGAITHIIPPGASYLLENNTCTGTVSAWFELR